MEGFTLQHGESGEQPATPEELQERLKVVEERVRRDAREIVEVLRIDFPQFISDTVKNRFLASDATEDLREEDVRALKDGAAQAGRQAVEEIVPALEDWSIWLEVPGPAPAAGERRTLQANAEVHSRIQRVASLARGVLERHKLLDAGDVSYKLPRKFIPGRGYVVSFVESYWRNVEEYQALGAALKTITENERKKKQLDRWESA